MLLTKDDGTVEIINYPYLLFRCRIHILRIKIPQNYINIFKCLLFTYKI